MATSGNEISASDVAILNRLGINPDSPEVPKFPSEEYVAATFPSEDEIKLSLQQWYYANDESSKELLNGAKPLHLIEVYDLARAYWLPRLPSLKDLVLVIWKLIPSALRKTIKEKAKNATTDDKASIASIIVSFVATALAAYGFPPIIVRTLLGPIARQVVDWIVDNVNELPD
ncbi:uncharacterized protein F4822DRAFT_115417 [Hypoxylon trugodes]|uniref:uncharacterized protein n=1 Tax=Hypoxylon trugodes TaxID=326681 RepID=UPI00218FCC5C|nr:uncharacterized protein F4822DRAFT_115417 [Hypoxylon trugodes]KAI1392094.1 hypothetical protein F4822DRAFT_115417 [Hypoxylon trugodes]